MTALDQLLTFIGQVVLYEGSSSDATLNRPLVCRRSMADFWELPSGEVRLRPEVAVRYVNPLSAKAAVRWQWIFLVKWTSYSWFIHRPQKQLIAKNAGDELHL